MPSAAGRRRARTLPWISAIAATLVWAGAALLIAWPVSSAEDAAHRGDQAATRGLLPEASQYYEQAIANAPVTNAAYFDRLIGVLIALNEEPTRVRNILARRLAADPASPISYLGRARYEAGLPADIGRHEQAIADYRQAVRLNPYELSIREEFAAMLIRLDKPQLAIEQLEMQLWINDRLDPAEPERLRPEQAESIRSRIAALRNSAGND